MSKGSRPDSHAIIAIAAGGAARSAVSALGSHQARQAHMSASTSRLDELFERAGVGIAQMDTSGRYVWVNDRYCEIVGRARDELLAGQLQDFTYPDDLPTSLDAFIRVIETGQPLVIDQRHVRRDGSSVWLSNSVSVGRDSHGKVQYVLAIAQEVTARKEVERKLNQRETELRMVLDSAADGLYCVDRDGKLTLCNAAFLRMLGFRREEEAIGRDLHEVIHYSRPDGSRYPREETPIYNAARHGVHAHVTDEVFFRVDGTSFPVEYWVRPIVRETEVQGAVCTFINATDRKQAEARHELINHELAHRVKNTLAIVQVLVRQTLRNASKPQDALAVISNRLNALSQAHNVLTHTRTGNASVMDVVEGAVSVHRSADDRIRLSGPPIDLGTKASLALTLALHELCTNAQKYGALSNETGHVSIEWSVTGGARDARFQLTWKESGGPPVKEPTGKGFGSRLIVDTIGADFGGRVKLSFDPDGVVWTLDAPLTPLKRNFFDSDL
jgi:PAS domain S-box-containing protein